MPYEELDIETDRNPQTEYEDTTGHERVGFRVDESQMVTSNADADFTDDGDRTILDNLQDKMLEHTDAVSYINALYPDQMDVKEAEESWNEQTRKL